MLYVCKPVRSSTVTYCRPTTPAPPHIGVKTQCRLVAVLQFYCSLLYRLCCTTLVVDVQLRFELYNDSFAWRALSGGGGMVATAVKGSVDIHIDWVGRVESRAEQSSAVEWRESTSRKGSQTLRLIATHHHHHHHPAISNLPSLAVEPSASVADLHPLRPPHWEPG